MSESDKAQELNNEKSHPKAPEKKSEPGIFIKKSDVSDKPLWFAFGFMLATIVLVFLLRKTNFYPYAFIVGVVFSQMCIDLYKGTTRPYWSAVFRLAALLGWATQVTLQWIK